MGVGVGDVRWSLWSLRPCVSFLVSPRVVQGVSGCQAFVVWSGLDLSWSGLAVWSVVAAAGAAGEVRRPGRQVAARLGADIDGVLSGL